MKISIICFLLLLFAGCARETEQSWRLVWSDEFDYTGLPDTANWGHEVGFIRNNELQYYTADRIENSVVSDGNLLIIGILVF